MAGPTGTGGDGANEVGRVSVRVVPDATGFRADLERQLEAETAGVTGEVEVKANLVGAEKAEAKLDAVARDRTANIDTDLNADKLAAQTKAAAEASTAKVEIVGDIDLFQRRLLADLQSSLGKMDAKFALTPEGEDLRRQAEGLVSRIANQIKLEIPLDLAEAAQARQLSKDLVDNAKAYEKSLKKLQEPLVFDNNQYSFKQIDAFERRVQKLKDTIASEDLTFENTEIGLKKQFKLDQKIAEFIEGQSFDIKLNPEFDFRFKNKLKKFEPEPIKLALDPAFDFKLKKKLRALEPDPIKVALDPQFDYRFKKKLKAFEPEPIKIGLDPKADYRLRQRLSQLQSKMTVQPDLSNFQKEAIASLNKAFETVEAQIGLSFAEEEYRATLLRAKAEAEAVLSAEIPVEPIGALSARAKIKAITESWEAGAKALIPVEPEMDLFQQRLLSEITAVERYLEANIPATPEGERFRAELKAMVEWAQAGIKIEIPVGIEEGSAARTAMLGRVDTLKAFGGIPNLADLSGLGKEFAGVGINAGRAAGGLISIAVAGGVLLAVLALLSPAIAILSGLLLTIPAAVLAFAAPIGAIALGLDGIKKAAEKAGLYEDSNGEKKGGGKIGAALEGLKTAVSDTFEDGLEPAFERIVGLVPKITPALAGVAQGLTDVFSGVVDAMSQGEGPDQIRNIISNIGTAFSQAAPGIRDFTAGILELVSAMSNKFPGIAEAINRTGESFLGWVRDFIDSGDLDKFTRNLGDSLSGIGNVFSTLFNDGIDNMSSDAYVDKIQEFVDAINELVTVTLPSLADSFAAIADVLDPIVTAFETAQLAAEGFGDALNMIPGLGGNPLKAGPVDLTSLIPGFGGAGGGLGLGDLVKLTNDWLTNPSGEGDARQQGAQLAKMVRDGFKETMDAGLQLGVPELFSEDVGAAVSQQIKDAINVSSEDQQQALRSAFTADGVDSAVSQQLTTKVTQAVESARQVMAGLGPILQEEIDAALLPLNTLADGVGEKVGLAFSTIGSAVDTAFGAIFLTVTARSQDLKDGIANAFTDGFSGIPGKISSALSGVPQAITGALKVSDSVNNAMNQAVSSIQMNGGAITAAMITAFSGVPGAIAGQMGAGVSTVASFCGQMVNTALSFAGAMESAGRSIGASFAAGIASSADLVAGAASALMSVARAFIPSSPAEKGPFSGSGWVDNSGFAVGQAFAKGLSDSTGVVVDAAGSMMQQVSDLLNSPQSSETLQELLSLQSQAADLQANGASKADKAELDHIKDFNSLVQSRLKLRDSELKTMTKMNNLQVDAWKQEQQVNKEQKKTVGQQAQAMKDGFKDALEPLTQLTPDLLAGRGKSTIYEAGKIDYTTKAELDALKIKQQQLDMQRQMLQLQAKSSDSPELQNQIALLQTQKDRLALQAEELEYWSKYVDTSRDLNDRYEEAGAKLQDMPIDFAKATGQQLMSDLGMSGNGMIPQLLTEGTKYIFNVAGVDDALSAQQRLQNKRSQGLVGR